MWQQCCTSQAVAILKNPHIYGAAAILTLCMAPPGIRAQANSADRVDPASTASAPPNYTAMTEGERFDQFLRDLGNPFSIVSSAAAAGLGQWKDRPHEWKQGAEAYGLRFASSYGEHMVRGTLLFGASSLFHEDNRYRPSGESGFGHRVGYAIESEFLARGDNGKRHVSASRVVALVGAALLSRFWQPESTRSLRSAGANLSTTIGVGVAFNVVREFWPRKQ